MSTKLPSSAGVQGTGEAYDTSRFDAVDNTHRLLSLIKSSKVFAGSSTISLYSRYLRGHNGSETRRERCRKQNGKYDRLIVQLRTVGAAVKTT